MNCKRCLKPRAKKHTLSITVSDEQSDDEGVVVGSVDVNLCSTCANELADLLLDFVRDNCQEGDLRSGTRVEY